MLKALLWKEFREQRQLILAAWLLALVLPLFLVAGMAAGTPDYEFGALGPMVSAVLMMFVWPVFALATGATTVAADMADGSLGFLLSRPVSRSRIWATKVAAGAAAMALVVFGSAAIAMAFDYLVSGRFRLLGGDVSFNPNQAALPLASFTLLFGALFVGAHYCSLFFRRPLAAALAGVVVSFSMVTVVSTLWIFFVRPAGRGADIFFGAGAAGGVPLALIGLLISAWWIFSHGELFGAHPARRMAIPLVVVTVVVTLAGAVPASYAAMRTNASWAAGLPSEFRLVDGNAVLVEKSLSGLGTRLVAIDARGGKTEVLGDSNAEAAVLSPDGGLIAYVRAPALNPFPAGGEVRVVNRDGSDDRAVMNIIDGRLRSWRLRFYGRTIVSISPDNRWIGLHSYRGVVLAPVDGASPEATYVGFVDRSWPGSSKAIGWTSGAAPELLYTRSTDERTEIVAYDPRSASRRVVAGFDGRFRMDLRGSGQRTTDGRSWSWYPVWLESAIGDRMELVDTQTGERVALTDTPCLGWGGGADDTRFVYGLCSGTRWADARMELRVYDPARATDEFFGVLDHIGEGGYGRELFLSPDGSRIAMSVSQVAGTAGAYVVAGAAASPAVGGDAARQPAAPSEAETVHAELLRVGMYPIGWLDNDHLVVATGSGYGDVWNVAVEVINVETHAVRSVYER